MRNSAFISVGWVGCKSLGGPTASPRRPNGRTRWSHPARMTLEEEVNPGIVDGTDLRIVQYPDPRLRAPNVDVKEFDSSLAKTAKEMLKVMYASRGVGLAAPQVGLNLRLMVFNPEGDPKAWVHETVLVNPQILDTSGAEDVEEEGCLSFPGMSGKVSRRKWVKVSAQRLNGKTFTVKYTGWKARIFQHEYDHLDGIVYIDRLDDSERARVAPVLSTLVASYSGDGPAAL
mmetsp:Transcript_3583/g.6794  ORF Transcript_3583/g.6794 Transcript_3583/m.6794 type:complete len:230 (-) Transcript_3583:2063-2752(-)